MAAAAAGSLLSQLFVRITAEGMEGTAKATAEVAKGMQKVKEIGGQLEATFHSLSAGAIKIAAPFAVASGILIGFAKHGFEGTVELNRFTFAIQLFSREVAGAMVPVLNLMTQGVRLAGDVLRNLGPTGQKALLMIAVGVTAVTVAAGVLVAAFAFIASFANPLVGIGFLLAGAFGAVAAALYAAYQSSPELRAAIGALKLAFGQLIEALAPLAAILIKLGVVLLEAFVIDPLIRFVTVLTAIAVIMERVARGATIVAQKLGLIPKDAGGTGGQKTNVTLNQTGTESAEATFQRIQQAVLAIGVNDDEKDYAKRSAEALEKIEKWLDDHTPELPNAPAIPSIGEIAEGVSGIGALAGIARRLRKL